MPARKKPVEAVVTRRFPHPIARVFRAWSEPQQIEAWLRPDADCRLRVARFEFRESGEFEFRYQWDRDVSPVRGKFLTIVANQTLIYSWTPQPPDPYAGRETMVSVWFRAVKPGETEIEMRHTLFPDSEMRDRHQHGWSAAFTLLAQLL